MPKRLVGSHTMLKTFDNCPKQFFHRYIVKDQPFVESEEMKWGNRVHEAMEKRVKTKQPLPQGMEGFEKYVITFDDNPGVLAEKMMGMNAKGRSVAFFDNNEVFFRGKADLVAVKDGNAFILDWKTGRKWEDPKELEEHAMLLKIGWPQLKSIKGAYVWLKTNELGRVYDLGEKIPETFNRVVSTMKQIVEMKEFPPRENKLCPWCSVTSCSFNPRRPG